MPSADTVQVLKDARALIADPVRWTQGAYARDASGGPVDEAAPEAFAYDAEAALIKTTLRHSVEPGPAALRLQAAMGVTDITEFNDTHSHAEVLAKFDEAIAAEEAKAHG